MTQSPTPSATESWIRTHLEVCPIPKVDFTWYVALELVYKDYYDQMQRQRDSALTKQEFPTYCKLIFGGRCRLGARRYTKRSYNPRTRGWEDMPSSCWVIDGVRYYVDKIGGDHRFGV